MVVFVVVDTLDLSPERANPNWPFPHCVAAAAAAVQALLHLHELALLRKRWRLSQGAKEMFLAKPLVKVGCLLVGADSAIVADPVLAFCTALQVINTPHMRRVSVSLEEPMTPARGTARLGGVINVSCLLCLLSWMRLTSVCFHLWRVAVTIPHPTQLQSWWPK